MKIRVVRFSQQVRFYFCIWDSEYRFNDEGMSTYLKNLENLEISRNFVGHEKSVES